MPNSPKLITLVKYGYKFKNNLIIALEAKYTSQTLIDDPLRLITTGFVPLFSVPDTFKIKPYVLANLTVNYFIDKNSYITLYVNNLFNEKFYYPVSYSLNASVTKYPGYKRNLYLGITYNF
jgi:outer membrane receptor protein involved in Fe transport